MVAPKDMDNNIRYFAARALKKEGTTTLIKSIFISLSIILLLAGASQYPLAARQNEGKRAAAPDASSGYYDSILIGIDKERGELTGFFKEYTGWDDETKSPRFSCIFFIYGKLQGDTYRITTWYPGDNEYINGELKFVVAEGLSQVSVRLEEEHGGCWNVHPFARDVGLGALGLEKRGDWIGVRVVSANKTFLHKGPKAQLKGRAYLVKHDPVRVFKLQAGWVEVEYGTDKVVRGWIKETDLFSPYPETKGGR
jgi:hypothetical protein